MLKRTLTGGKARLLGLHGFDFRFEIARNLRYAVDLMFNLVTGQFVFLADIVKLCVGQLVAFQNLHDILELDIQIIKVHDLSPSDLIS